MKFNLEYLKQFEKPAVLCKTEDEALILCNEVYRLYPELMKHYWERGETKWHLTDNKEGVCYAPHIYDRLAKCMQLSPKHYWVKHGYTIIPFQDLYYEIADYGEIHTPCLTIDYLLREEGILCTTSMIMS